MRSTRYALKFAVLYTTAVYLQLLLIIVYVAQIDKKIKLSSVKLSPVYPPGGPIPPPVAILAHPQGLSASTSLLSEVVN
jgi:hypothetical protein